MTCPPNISISPSVNQSVKLPPSLGTDTSTNSILRANSSALIGGSSLQVPLYRFSIALETTPYASASDPCNHATPRVLSPLKVRVVGRTFLPRSEERRV